MHEKYYWVNEKTRSFLKDGYLSDGETVENRIKDISIAAEKILKIDGFAAKFEDYMSRGWISLASPVWSNFGKKRGLPISCNGSLVSDTLDSILYKTAEVGCMTKHGAGTSAYFGDLRERGAVISSGGKSSGPVHFMELFQSVSEIVSQSNVRRGSFAAYLPVEHPDILEFLRIRSEGHPIQHISIGVCITDKWMKEMIAGDPQKRDIWAKIIQKRFESGYPYLFFTDNVNNNAPQVYKDTNKKIFASNLCVSGDQRIPSNFGLVTVKELYEKNLELQLFDNNKIVNASKMELIEKDADTYKIVLDNGMSHTVTSYHKVNKFKKSLTNKKTGEYTIVTENVECKNLKIGDKIAIQTNKGIFGTVNMPKEAFLLGLYQGDGTQTDKGIIIDIWENNFDLLDEIQECHDYVCEKYDTQKSCSSSRIFDKPKFYECVTFPSNVKKKRLMGRALKKSLNFEKGYVPQWIWESDEETQWQYIRGLFYTDGTVGVYSGKGDAIQLSLSNISLDFLKEIQILLANLGMQTSIRIMRNAGPSLLPDGKGGRKYYNSKDCWRIIIGNKNDCLLFEKKTKFLTRKGVSIEDREYRDNTKKFYKINSIEYIGKQDVFCCKVESDEHLFVCNGFITHNCSEIALNSSLSESFVCDLSSLNLLHYDEWKDTDLIEILTYFLDAVMEEYIIKTKDIEFLKSAHNFAKNQRALGVGVLGWHSYLQSKMIPFESMEAKLLNSSIWKLIRDKTFKASREMAIKYGEPEALKGYGVRNITTMAIAPTTSSSFILGQVSPSIEPLNSNYFVKDLAKGKFTYKNPFLKKVLAKIGKDTKEVWEDILKDGGSVQKLPFLSENEKAVFKTFVEISQKEVVIQAIQRQKYIDQSQSLNLMIHPQTPAKEVSQLLIYGWENGIKTFYYQRGCNPSQVLNRNLLECKSCEA